MKPMSKQYLEEQYRLSAHEYENSRDENQKWDVLAVLSDLEVLASMIYGASYGESLRKYLKA